MHRQKKIRILLVGEDRQFAQSMRTILRSESDLDVVSFANTIDQVVASASDCHVAVIDAAAYSQTQLPTLLQGIYNRCTSLKIITVGVPSAPRVLLRLIESGAAGYLCTEQVPMQLAHMIRSVYTAKAWLSPEVTSMVMSRVSELHKTLSARSGGLSNSSELLFELTAREQEVLTLLVQGLSNREIASQLIIEYGTAKNHVHNILRKLNVNSREEAAKLYSIGTQQEPSVFLASPPSRNLSTPAD